MRLMARDVEIAHAEREVDRVEILEGAWERNEVGDQKQDGQQAELLPHVT